MSATKMRPGTGYDLYNEESTCDTDHLNSLLRSELSAVETYDRALKKFDGQPIVENIRHIRKEHRDAVDLLEQRIRQFDGQPVATSGPWGTFAAVITGTAKLAGSGTLLAALKRGEEHGIGAYEDALGNDMINEDCKTAIRVRLLPQCREHVVELERLMDLSEN